MQLNVSDLQTHLAQRLAPVYIVAGDEPLQLGEACDAIRAAAKQRNFTERHVLDVEKGFDWNTFFAISNSLSLFAQCQLIELRMPKGKPEDAGAKALIEYAQNPSPDSLLLVITGKLDKSSKSSKWFSRLEQLGVFIAVWPVDTKQLPGWIQQRARGKGMQLTPAALRLIVERVEGNMLAAVQELDKLFLLFGSGQIDEPAVLEAVSDSARYDIFALFDVALSGDVKRVSRMIDGLRGEGAEPVLLNWILARELRSMLAMSLAVSGGLRAEQAVAQAGVWQNRKPMVTAGLKRHPTPSWQDFLQHASGIDRIIKGMAAGNAWDELLQLSLGIAGTRLFAKSALV
ncbi:MAG TPA: DNA polymerase III subunit delta [Gammaproteobacteria bacterium]